MSDHRQQQRKHHRPNSVALLLVVVVQMNPAGIIASVLPFITTTPMLPKSET
ncbi:MAG: hypothetical protein II954_10460 [Synergistaceae bacterium]|nr:hypothetical protein [Synergistaceae bacterium]